MTINLVRRLATSIAALVGVAALHVAPAAAQPVSVRDSFPIGSEGSVLCTAQSMATDRGLVDMFDRGYSIICRDAAVPIGQIYALRARGADPIARLAALRAGQAACQSGAPAAIEDLGSVETLACRLTSGDVNYVVYTRRAGNTIYVAQGLAGYDSALRLALRSVVADRPVGGAVSIATTGAGDPAAFARLQAGALDRDRALAEAYRRNNAGSYAESAEFFSVLGENRAETDRAEALVNEALQKSNLGRYSEADALFAEAADMASTNPVTARRLRNYRVIHLLNQGRTDAALTELNRPLPPPPVNASVQQLVIDHDTSARLSAEAPGARRLSGSDGLSEQDKIQVLDSQALQLRGTILRLQNHDAEAVAPFSQALDQLVAIRGGRVAATVWMRAQILDELGGIAEKRGDRGGAEQQYQGAVALIASAYPGSSALLSAQGQLAAFYARTDRPDQALALFRTIVAASAEGGETSLGLRRILAPYFELLAARGSDAAAVADLFAAGQVLLRPGVAQTQAVLARELSGGSDEASRLFRQSVNLTRDIERARVELARFEAVQGASAADAARAATLRASLEQMQQAQTSTQASLAQFPRYRAVSGNALALADLQQLLGPGEAYYKMIVLDDDSYGLFVTANSARAFRIPARPAELDRQVDALRGTISIIENGQQLTYPFNLELASRLYQELFAPVAGEVGAIHHLIFEPDGAMLRLPPNLLVMDHAAVDAYRNRVAAPNGDEFDFRGIPWLGRDRDISTAVSARAFRDVRRAPPSHARGEYLGFGQNAPAEAFFRPSTGTRGVTEAGRDDCSWSLAAWSHPIPATELFTAQHAISADVAGATDIVTGAAFTDSAIKQRTDLDQFRILHFATHGLVSAPRPECPARPALLTSFGPQGSDGLLTFSEIFDLRLDADLIILSACDTAGRASVVATQEAGLTTGGDFALDGLVRAFVGAGGRMIVASHWPVPDDFNATQRLISGLFTAPVGTGTAAALRAAQRSLMDEAPTSHPFYWAAFAVIGDGAAPVIRPAPPPQTASAN